MQDHHETRYGSDFKGLADKDGSKDFFVWYRPRSEITLKEGSLEVKLPTIWTDEKQRWGESEKRREEKKKEDHKRCAKR